MWSCLENIPSLTAVPVVWQSWLGDNFVPFSQAFLRKLPRRATSYPCARECGCFHQIIERPDGSLIGVCRCDPWNCDDFAISLTEAALLELNWSRLGRAISAALGCDPRETDLGIYGARQIAAFSAAAIPVVLIIQDSKEHFNYALMSAAARLGERFIILAPTSRFLDGPTTGLLKTGRAGFFDLNSHISMLPNGTLQARKTAGELFSPLLPATAEPTSANTALQLFALVEALDSENPLRKAPTITVFRLSFVQGLPRKAVAKQCDCVPSLITLRIREIETKLGRKRSELLQFSSHFQAIEDSLSDPRARRISRTRAAYGDPPLGGDGD
jgi:hypothetical protein